MSLKPATTAGRLDRYLEVEFTFIDTGPLAADIDVLGPGEAGFILAWVKRIASTQVELAHQFIRNVLPVAGRLDRHTIESWALHALDCYDQKGLRAAMEVIRNIDRFVLPDRRYADGVVFDDVSAVMLNFLQGLSGRRLKLEKSERAFTDSETLYLPALIARFERREDNFLLCKAMAAMMWAQTRFGTFRVLRERADSVRTVDLRLANFAALETARLERRIGVELPGLYREMVSIGNFQASDDPVWEWALARVRREGATAADSFDASLGLDPSTMPECPPYHVPIDGERAMETMNRRIARERHQLAVALADALDEQQAGAAQTPSGVADIDLRAPSSADDDPGGFELTVDGMPLRVPEGVRQLVQSIRLDLGAIPPEYLTPAGSGEYDAIGHRDAGDPDSVWLGTYHEEGATFYDEWDHRRQHYRKNWCVMREHSVSPVYDGFPDDTLVRYSGLLRQLRKTFEAMRDEDRLLKRQSIGDNIDIDAVVEALADTRQGREMTARLFTRMHRSDRNIAVAFMVDMSGSTRGWINDAEREALLLLCEVLESLGDRYAIYGFTSLTRKRCELFHVKRFDEDYGEEVKARISGIRPREYTRMGFAIRHLTRLLAATDASTRVLITLSDGKPDDYSDYRGEYGIEDSRRALMEARRIGVHPYCITIDETARDYLPHLYGHAAYTVVDNVRDLPLKVSDIYRKLTT